MKIFVCLCSTNSIVTWLYNPQFVYISPTISLHKDSVSTFLCLWCVWVHQRLWDHLVVMMVYGSVKPTDNRMFLHFHGFTMWLIHLRSAEKVGRWIPAVIKTNDFGGGVVLLSSLVRVRSCEGSQIILGLIGLTDACLRLSNYDVCFAQKVAHLTEINLIVPQCWLIMRVFDRRRFHEDLYFFEWMNSTREGGP